MGIRDLLWKDDKKNRPFDNFYNKNGSARTIPADPLITHKLFIVVFKEIVIIKFFILEIIFEILEIIGSEVAV